MPLCVVCGKVGRSEAAHFCDGTHGMGRKSLDLSALPLCAACHRTGRLAYHRISEERFCEVWGLNHRTAAVALGRRFATGASQQ